MTRWALHHQDIAVPLLPVPAEPGAAGATLTLWLQGVPLGRLDYLAAELPVASGALAAAIPRAIAPAVGDRLFGQGFAGRLPIRGPVEEPVPPLGAILAEPTLLERLRATLALPAVAPGEGLSVVVCTRDRPEQLERCLASLDGAAGVAEVVVVDNGSQGEATRLVVARHPGVRCLVEPRPGLSLARNTGLAAARQPIIAFTDDDVVVHADWAPRLLAAFSAPEVMCVTGLVLPTALETEAQLVFERELGGFGQGLQRMDYDAAFFRRMQRFGAPVWRIGAGANMALRRRAVELVGGFDPRLGAGAAGCSEDSELWYRLLAAGTTCRYEPAAVVFHEHRREWQDLQRQMHAYMRGHVTALLLQYGQHRHAGNLRRLLLSLPRYYAGLVLQGLRHGFRGRYRLLGPEIGGMAAALPALRLALAQVPPPRPGAQAALS